jgi:hypothetical protein
VLFEAVKGLLTQPKKDRVKIGYKLTSGKTNRLTQAVKSKSSRRSQVVAAHETKRK